MQNEQNEDFTQGSYDKDNSQIECKKSDENLSANTTESSNFTEEKLNETPKVRKRNRREKTTTLFTKNRVFSSHAYSHSHSHSHDIQIEDYQRRRIKIFLFCIVIPLLIFTIVSASYLYPPKGNFKKINPISSNSKVVKIKVISLKVSDCVDNTTNKDLLQNAVCGRIENTFTNTTSNTNKTRIVPVHVPKEILENGMKVSDEITTIKSDINQKLGTKYIFWDYERHNFILVYVVLYILSVVLVARFKGLAAIFGLITSVFVITFFMIPAILEGENPIFVVIVAALMMIFLSVYLAHGISIRTTTALLGTLLGLSFTLILGFLGVEYGKLSGAVGEEPLQLLGYFPNLNLQQILVCGIVISSLGALNDVTITQASAVWEIYSLNPTMSIYEIFKRSMAIGKDHIASTVYTLAFAYVGSAFTTILLASLVKIDIVSLLSSYHIAEEIIRTLISSIGLVLAIPLTTLLAATLVKKTAKKNDKLY
ncbi:YibE/F family protein [Actinomyces sp. zg-332]|uniref:YibE/F family protein n=1 Tax=Actinomyces sp. zg-332 TaxID=2708340 RepID=UPI0014213EFE|nr:YibE/F family protein [Actinomyces sp. zg-332]QPK94527.1 YibE/F family protein [Actinomyces sp. zg-332]